MQAIVQNRYGAPERVLELEEVDRPRVGDDDVLIRVRASGVNRSELFTRQGHSPNVRFPRVNSISLSTLCFFLRACIAGSAKPAG